MYFNSLDDNMQAPLSYDNQIVQQLLQGLHGLEQYFTKPSALAPMENESTIINKAPPMPEPKKAAADSTK
jgi:hypothetical protein